MKYGFIRGHEERFGVVAMCRGLQVSRSGYYEWRGRPESDRDRTDRALVQHICRVHAEHYEAYGSVKTWKALNSAGVHCGKHRVARLRRRFGIEARRKRRFRVMTEHRQTAAAPDLLQRQFTSLAPDRVWVGDLTCIRTREGWLHLAVLLDLYSRRVVGWAMGRQPAQSLTHGALSMALEQRQPAAGLIHHTDRGATYTAAAYRALLSAHGLRASMNGRKSAYDNAVAESFFSNLKNEMVHHCDFQTRDQARAAIFAYIEVFYNRRRIHQSLDYRTPEAMEQKWNGA